MELENISDCESDAEMLAGSNPVAYPMKTYKVKRGFEMRFHPDEYFEMELYPIPKGVELYDDVYYIDYGDGQPLKECYSRVSSEKYDMYQCGNSWEETVEYHNNYWKEFNSWKNRFNRVKYKLYE